MNPALLGLTIFAVIGAGACFAVPLRGMHGRIAAEKERLLAESNARLEAAMHEVFRQADAKRRAGVEQLHQLLESLVVSRDIVAAIPTWPWDTRTLTAFLSALLLPLAAGMLRLAPLLLSPL